MRLSLIRHGDPNYALDALTPRGRQEAAALADGLADAGLTLLACSPLGRARETAAPVARTVGLEPRILPWTAELELSKIIDHDDRPIAPWNIPGDLVRDAGAPTGDSWHRNPRLHGYDFEAWFRSLRAESDEFLATLGLDRDGGSYRVTDPAALDQRVAIVCHAGFGLSWLAHLLDLPPTLVWCGFFLPTASVTTILLEQRRPGRVVPRVLGVGDVSHLRRAGLPDNYQGLTANHR